MTSFSPGMDSHITAECKDVTFTIQRASFTRRFLVSHLARCDILLVIKWFREYAPVMDWATPTLTII